MKLHLAKGSTGALSALFLVTAAAALIALPVAALSVPGNVRIPRVKEHPAGTPSADALFSHQVHAAHQCYACHPGIFPQARLGFTHADMTGARCGACHDGKRATAIAGYPCESCHAPK